MWAFLCGSSVFALVLYVAPRTRLRSLDRLHDAAGVARRPSRLRRSAVEDPRDRALMCTAACVCLGWLLGGWPVAAVGLPAGVALSWWVGRLESPADSRAREEVERDLPLACDLLAACATAGRPVDESLQVVSTAVGGALRDRLGAITARLALGADPLTEWRRAGADPQLGAFARAMERTIGSGAPLADGLTRLAEDCRRERRTRALLRARNVGVKAAGPLATCFLPAFMVVGVVPTIAGAFANLVL